MAIKRNGTVTKYAFLHNGKMLKKGYRNGSTLIWAAGSMVTYHVDTGVSYIEEVDNGATCLAPTAFTPTKSGWTFAGWREDTAADSSVLSSKTMGLDPITLYAVFEKDVTATFVSYNSTTPISGKAYYNNGNKKDYTVTAPNGAAYTGWTWRGWSGYGITSAEAVVVAEAGNTLNCGDTSRIYYGLYQQTVTATFVSYEKSVAINGLRYYNAAGNVKNASVAAPTGNAYSGWTWRGWSGAGATTADASVNVPNGGTISEVTGNTTFYGLYKKTVTRTFYSMNDTSSKSEPVSGTAYYNAAGTTEKAAIVVPSGGTYTGWSWRGWSGVNVTTADANVVSESGKTIYTLDDGDVYGLYQQSVTLLYDGNSADSGSVTSQTGTRYYNASGNTKNASFTLASNGYTKGGHKWIAWAQGSASGTQRAAGASVTLSANTTFYAVWEQTYTPYYVTFTDYPITMTASGIDNGTARVSTTESWYFMSVRKNPDANGTGYVKGSVSLPTQGCNKVAVTYMCQNTSTFVMNGDTLISMFTSYNEDTSTLTCYGDTFALNLDLYDATSDNTAELRITSIYFYYE